MDSESHGIGRFMGHFDDKTDNGSIGRLTAINARYSLERIVIEIDLERHNRSE